MAALWDLPWCTAIRRGAPMCTPYPWGQTRRFAPTTTGIPNEPKWPYKKVYFSVVYHPRNDSLKPSITEYQKLIGFNDRFFAFSSDKLIKRAKEINKPALSEWVRWYQELYYF